MGQRQLEGAVAAITGASSGIGLALARELHRNGVQLALTGRSQPRIEEVGDELEAVTVIGDLEDPDTPGRLLEATLSRYGHCDIVWNGAGTIEVGSIEAIDIENACRMARVNVEGAYRVAYTFLKHFVREQRGHLINASSVLGTKVRPTAGAYAGTKHAIEALSEALRMEVAGTPVEVTCIEPGLVATELHRDWAVHPRDSMGIAEPLQPEDVARSVVFLLSQPDHVRIPRLAILPRDHEI